MSTSRPLAILLCGVMAFAGCAINEFVNPDGSITKTRSISIPDARDILFFALEAFDLVTARIAAYEAQGDELSEPDAVQLLLAEAREAFLRRGIDFLNREFDQLIAGQDKIHVPLGLIRQVEKGIEAETGVPSMLMSQLHKPRAVGANFSFGLRPPPSNEVSPNNETWQFVAAGFAPLL